MAEEARKGVIVEFDFAVADGAGILYRTTEKMFAEYEIPFSPRIEAQHLAGFNYQGGLAEYFAEVKTKKTAAKAAKDLAAAFADALTAALPAAVTDDFRAFAKALTSRGVKVIVATRADAQKAREAFGDLMADANFALYQETSAAYGAVKWDAWRRAAASNRVHSYLAVAVAGSGLSVKAALLAGMGVVAVPNDRVAWQDFGGADEEFDKLDESAAKSLAKMLKA